MAYDTDLSFDHSTTPDMPSMAVAPPRRNGYSAVISRVLDLLAKNPPVFAGRPRTALLSRVDERRLKDGDEAQLGANGLAIATRRERDDWRAFLFDHFRRRYDLVLLFDSARTRVA
jgi:hypothetical protein